MKATMSKDGQIRFDIRLYRRIGLDEMVEGIGWNLMRSDRDWSEAVNKAMAVESELKAFRSRKKIMDAVIKAHWHDGDSVKRAQIKLPSGGVEIKSTAGEIMTIFPPAVAMSVRFIYGKMQRTDILSWSGYDGTLAVVQGLYRGTPIYGRFKLPCSELSEALHKVCPGEAKRFDEAWQAWQKPKDTASKPDNEDAQEILRELRVVIVNDETQVEFKVVRDVIALALKATGGEKPEPGVVKFRVSNLCFICACQLQAALDLATVKPSRPVTDDGSSAVSGSRTDG